ncbi:MAG: 3'-5' exonuclease [Clostridia bacterium]|nr:3'-5' exonuclease [Clostridia bacterium]
MNLVFFDIECAVVRKTVAKICAFGYVVCDEQFNIIKKEDILINPRGEFHLTDRKGDKGIILPYEYAEFKKHPAFPKVYPYIKSLLEDENNVILGHSTMNDVKYLNLETKRFRLPSFKFSFSDSQLIYMTLVDDFSHQFGLEQIAKDLGVDFTPHRAADDAYATMRIVEAMCKAKGCNYFELAKLLKMYDGKIKNYAVTAPTSGGLKNHNAKVREEKRERSKIRTEFFNFVSRKRSKRGAKYEGKVFTFSRCIEDNLSISKDLIEKIYAAGGRYSQHVTHSDFYIKAEGDNSPRTLSAEKLGVKIVDIAQLGEMLDD